MPLPVSGTIVAELVALTGSPGTNPAAGAAFAGAATFAFASVTVLVAVLELVSVFVAGASGLLESTETFPVNAGIASSNAESIKHTAAVIVTFERIVAVPRGASAELETLLVKSAPASVLPGCNNTAAIKTKHETKKIAYKKYSNLPTPNYL